MTAGIVAQLPPIAPATYQRHSLHTSERSWPETNCYVDLWIELLHALKLDPVAALACTLAMNFEGDQWTFFKPSLADLYTLYGIDVQEMTIWRSVFDHTIEHIDRGRLVLVEVDAFHLPDTAGVSYQLVHSKTTIAAHTIDPATRTLRYFHNAGYFTAEGDDFDGLFGQGQHRAPANVLPPYVEFVRLDHLHHAPIAWLATEANRLARKHAGRRPRTNPVTRYRERILRDVAWLSGEEMEVFHQYAFATLRQCGACAEIAAVFLRWIETQCPEIHTAVAADAFDTIATNAKSLQFKVARAVSTKKPTEFAPMLDAMEHAWDTATAQLTMLYGD